MIGEHARDDLRRAGRRLWRAKPFAAAATLTLAVGIATTTVMFALVEGVLLRPLPVADPDRLVVAWRTFASGRFSHWPFRVADIEAIGRESRVFERVAGVSFQGATPGAVVEKGVASEVRTTSVTGAFFSTLGVRPLLGRALEPADDLAGAEKTLVITRGLWQRRYGGAGEVIGRRVEIGEEPFTIVGVMPDLAYPRGVEGWMTVEAMASLMPNPTFRQAVRDENDLVARLRPGVTRAQAEHELQAVVARLDAEASAATARELAPVVRSLEDVVIGDVRPAIVVLFAAVGLVLVIASANVANLLLLRGEGRRAELAVRAALGAGRGRIGRELLAESLWLALAAAVLGVGASAWALPAILRLVPGGLPRLESVRIDAGVVLFATVVATLAAAGAGMAPALYAARADLVSALGTRGTHGAPGARRGRRALVVAQVALAVAVVAAAGLLTRSLLRLQRVDMGLTPNRLVVVTFSVPPAGRGEPRPARFANDLMRALESIPGVEKATLVNNPPLAGVGGWDTPQSVAEGQTLEAARSNPALNLEAVYPNHFATLGVPLRRGRAFTDADGAGATPVAIVSADVAARLWPGADPIGKRLRMGAVDTGEPWQAWRTVVGVVNPTRYRDLVAPRPTLYVPAPQFMEAAQIAVLRTAAPPGALAGMVRERVRAVDPAARVTAVAPFGHFLAAPLARPRFDAFLIGVFGAASLLLAAIGLYAVIAGSVRQRQGELGIRIALGATSADVLAVVLGEGLRLAGAGAAIGLLAAAAATHLLRGLLFDVHPLDPATLIGAAALLVAASALACALPARRALRVDPATALRAS
jgi:predicted permease